MEKLDDKHLAEPQIGVRNIQMYMARVCGVQGRGEIVWCMEPPTLEGLSSGIPYHL